MKPEEIVTLSFYEEIMILKENIALVRHIETKKMYVRKQINTFDEKVYRMLQNMSIPGIPEIYHILNGESGLIIIEEYINEPTLSTILQKHGILTVEQTIEIALQVCAILEKLHAADPPVIHRDLKPSNILVSAQGRVHLIDFDAAKTWSNEKSQDTVLMGTADFAAPEQFGFYQSDGRTDIYALGVILNVMLTGGVPKSILHEGPLKRVITKCTALEPSMRYANIRQVEEMLKKIRKNVRISKQIYGKKDENTSYNPTESKENVKKKTISWLPPGFRTHTPWKMFLAGVGYAMLLYLGLAESVDGEPNLITGFNRICALISLLLPVFFIGNYRGMSDKFPIARSAFLSIHVMGSLLWSIIFTFSLMVICVLMDSVVEAM